MLIIGSWTDVSQTSVYQCCRWKFVSLKVVSAHETCFSLPLSETLNHSINKPLAFSPRGLCVDPLTTTFHMAYLFLFLTRVCKWTSLGETIYVNHPKGLWKAKSGLFFLAHQCMIRRKEEKKAKGKLLFGFKCHLCLCRIYFYFLLTRNVNFPGKPNFSKNSQHKQFF